MGGHADANQHHMPAFTECQQSALARKHLLPLTTGHSSFVRLHYTHGEYFLALYETESDTNARFCAVLKNASIVNNITENGPCLFLICKNGQFEFQTTEAGNFRWWLRIFKDCGIQLIPFDDLYILHGCVGTGSFAKVFKGIHKYTKQEVCVKSIDKVKVQTANIYTEIKVLRKVTHPYISRLFAAYENENRILLVLEYLRGGELFDYLANHGAFNEASAKLMVRRILMGLNCLHRQGIVHRDLKTENLILEEENNPTSVKIIDFGLAATLGSPAMSMRCGSPGYVAPEILQEMPYGVKVDLFSAGVILYTVLGGYPPFRGANIKDILRSNLKGKVSFNHQRWDNVSQKAKDLILWMTNKDPDGRCSANQALHHRWFEGVPSSLSATVSRTPVPVGELKAAAPEVGSASTCASPGSTPNRPLTSGTTSPAAVQPPVAPTRSTRKDHPLAAKEIEDKLYAMASASVGDTQLIGGGPVDIWQPTPGVDSETAQSSAGTPVYRRLESPTLDVQSPSPHNRTRTRAKTGASSRYAQSGMVQSAARAAADAKETVDVVSENKSRVPVKSVATMSPMDKNYTVKPPTRSVSISAVTERWLGLSKFSTLACVDASRVLSKSWFKTKDGKELEAILATLTASNPVLDESMRATKNWHTWKQAANVTPAYLRACRLSPSRAVVSRQASSRLGNPVIYSDLDTWEDSVPSATLQKSRTGIKRSVRFHKDESRGQKGPSKAEIAPELRRFKSMPADPDVQTGAAEERSPIALEAEHANDCQDLNPKRRTSVARHRRRVQGAGYDPHGVPAADQRPTQSIATTVTSAPPEPCQLPSTQTIATTKKPFHFLKFRPRLSNADKVPLKSAPPDCQVGSTRSGGAKVVNQAAAGGAGPAPVATSAVAATVPDQPKRFWKVTPFKR